MALSKDEQHTLIFLKMAALELRRIAEEAPEMANRLMRIAQQLETETAELEQRDLARTSAIPGSAEGS